MITTTRKSISLDAAARMASVQQRIFDYWFDLNLQDQFLSTPERDAEIRSKFLVDVEYAENGSYDDLALRSAKESVAWIILRDQFPRNIYRGKARAYACDERNVQVVLHGIVRGFPSKLATAAQRMFYYMPLMHSENLEVQHTCLHVFRTDEKIQGDKEVGKTALEHALNHAQVIEKFGRFCGRNEVIGRKSTEEEEEFLKGEGKMWNTATAE